MSVLGARVGREVLVKLSVVVMLVLHHKVLKNPHVTLIDEAVDGDEHVGLNRSSNLLDLISILT